MIFKDIYVDVREIKQSFSDNKEDTAGFLSGFYDIDICRPTQTMRFIQKLQTKLVIQLNLITTIQGDFVRLASVKDNVDRLISLAIEDRSNSIQDYLQNIEKTDITFDARVGIGKMPEMPASFRSICMAIMNVSAVILAVGMAYAMMGKSKGILYLGVIIVIALSIAMVISIYNHKMSFKGYFRRKRRWDLRFNIDTISIIEDNKDLAELALLELYDINAPTYYIDQRTKQGYNYLSLCFSANLIDNEKCIVFAYFSGDDAEWMLDMLRSKGVHITEQVLEDPKQ